MTKSQQLSGLLSFLLLIGTPLTTLAADTTQTEDKKEATSKTSFTISGGSLSVDSSTGFSFDPKKVEDIIKGTTTLNLSPETKNSTLTIKDYRGTHEGWSLSVAMSKLTIKDGNGNDIQAIRNQPTLTITPSLSTHDSQALLDPKTPIILKTPTADKEGFGVQQKVLNAEKGTGEGNTQLNFTDTKITIQKQYDISKGDYSADLQWTLVNGTPELRAAL